MDLCLTEYGDIVLLEEPSNYNLLNCSFSLSKYKTLQCSFKVYDTESKKNNNINSLDCKFTIKKNKDNLKAYLVSDKEYIKQLATIRLKTYKNEIKKREDIGSKVHDYLHYNIGNKSILENIRKEVYNTVKNIFSGNIEVELTPVIIENNKFYSYLKVKIITSNNDIFEIDLEV